jgi:hypothetical protein
VEIIGKRKIIALSSMSRGDAESLPDEKLPLIFLKNCGHLSVNKVAGWREAKLLPNRYFK